MFFFKKLPLRGRKGGLRRIFSWAWVGQFFVFFRVLLVGRRFQWVGQFFVFFLADYLVVVIAVLVVAALVVVIAVLVVAALVVVIAVLVVVDFLVVVVTAVAAVAVVGAWVVREGGGLLTWRVRCGQLCRV